MGITLKTYLVATVFTLVTIHAHAAQPGDTVGHPQPIETYSQKTLLKNWAFSVCLAEISKDANERDDANATASAYLEFGQQPLEAYYALRDLAKSYANRKYSGSIKSEFNTMKCIDLYNSKELDNLAEKLSRKTNKPDNHQ